MTIADNYEPVRFTGNGSTTEFSFEFNILVASYLKVYFEVIATGVQTEQTTGFSVVFSSSGGVVTFDTPPADTVYVILAREIPYVQSQPYKTSTGFDAVRIEQSLDKNVGMIQQVKDDLARCLIFPIGSVSRDITLPTPVAGKALLWNASADAVINSTDDFDDIVTDATAQVAIATAAASSASGYADDSSSSATLSQNWATKIDGQVATTDYSSKAYAIGGTGVTSSIGAAKEWAVTTGAAVVAGYYSAKEWAIGTFTRGASGGGSAKDWANYTVGTVDDTEYSAKKYATDAAASAASLNIATPTANKHGALLYQNDTDDGYDALLTQGTSGQVLTSNGADAAPSWQDTSANGSWIVKDSGTFSGAVNFDITDIAKSTKITLYDMTPKPIKILTSSNNGSSFDTGASDYAWSGIVKQSNGTTITGEFDADDAKIDLLYLGNGSGSDDLQIEIIIWNPADTGKYTIIDYNATNVVSGVITNEFGRGVRLSAAKVDALRFYAAANIDGSYIVEELNV